MKTFLLALAVVIPTAASATGLQDGSVALTANVLCKAGFSDETIAAEIIRAMKETGIRNEEVIANMMIEQSATFSQQLIVEGRVASFCAMVDAFQRTKGKSK